MSKIEIKKGDCLKLLKKLNDGSVDMIFADPPYNLSGKSNQTVQSGKPIVCDKGEWDIINDLEEFNNLWIKECVRVLSDNGTIWISGTLHNHPSVGCTLKNNNLWIINDIVWYKRNASPLLSKTRLVPSTELIWLASKSKKYYFDYDLGKILNQGKQMRNLWQINAQRHLTKHPAEKPEHLLERIILLGSKENDLILDPFAGSGTTAVVAKKLNRNFIGFEISDEFVKIAKNRIKDTEDSKELIFSNKDINTDLLLKTSILNYFKK